MNFEIDNYNALHKALNQMCGGFDLPEETRFRCKLVANELLSNVLQHGGECAYFQVTRSGNQMVLCVRSKIAFIPPEKSVCADVFESSGRGLFLVDSICSVREYNEREGTKVIIEIENE